MGRAILAVLGGPRRQLDVRVVAPEVVAKAAQAEAGMCALGPGVRLSRLLDGGRHLGEARHVAPRALHERVVAGDRVVGEALSGVGGPRQDRGAGDLFVEAHLAPVEAPLAIVVLQPWRPLL